MHTLGIDLGTTLSRMAIIESDGRPLVIENAEGDQVTPSVVYFGEDGVLIGREAVVAGQEDHERVVRYVKRWLGDATAQWEINGVFYSAVDISAFILRKLRQDFERVRGPVGRAVITVPAYFDAYQRELTKEAGLQAGFPEVVIFSEPVAAALTYVLGNEKDYAGLAPAQTVLVYDLGGGTFDLSLVHYRDENVRVLASSGDLRLGGIDWNQVIVDQVARRFEKEHKLNVRQDRKFITLMDDRAEVAKCSLSNPNKSRTSILARNDKREIKFDMTRAEFEDWTKDLVTRTEALTEQILQDAELEWHQLNKLIVVGGATRMPMIDRVTQDMQRKMAAKAVVNYETMEERQLNLATRAQVSPVFAVAQGAALYGGLLGGANGDKSDRVTMVSARSLGILVQDDAGQLVNHIVIPKRTRLPASHTFTVGTVRTGQPRISVKLVETEERTCKDQDRVCVCRLSNLPPGLPEGSLFEVSLLYEKTGLLQVIARHPETGRVASASVERGVAKSDDAAESARG